MDERTILRRAKEVLLERGWFRGGGFCADSIDGRTGPVCISGAVATAVSGNAYEWGDVGVLVEARLQDLVPGGMLFRWNDREAKNLTEVIDLLDRALASLEPSKTPELVA